MNLNEIIDKIDLQTGYRPKRSRKNFIARCPAHNDRNPSLSLAEGFDGKILLTCFAGCTLETICASLQIETKDLFPQNQADTFGQVAKTVYEYCDAKGKKLFSKARVEPGSDGKKKSFYWERVDENGQRVKNLNGCERVLYRLPEILKATEEGKAVYLVEGEKDADRLSQEGIVATTTTDTLRWCQKYTVILSNADVVILFDYDKAGFERRELLCKELYGKVNRLRVAHLPGLVYQENHGQDVSDWLARGHTKDQLVDLVEKTPDYRPANSKGGLKVVSLSEFLSMNFPKRELLLTPFLPSQGLCLLYAKRGVGKTHVALGIGFAVATGGNFLKWVAPCPKKVLYIDGEMPAISMQEKLLKLSRSRQGKLPDPRYFRLMTPDLQDGPIPNLITLEGQKAAYNTARALFDLYRSVTSTSESPDVRFELTTNGLTVRRKSIHYNKPRYVTIRNSKTCEEASYCKRLLIIVNFCHEVHHQCTTEYGK